MASEFTFSSLLDYTLHIPRQEDLPKVIVINPFITLEGTGVKYVKVEEAKVLPLVIQLYGLGMLPCRFQFSGGKVHTLSEMRKNFRVIQFKAQMLSSELVESLNMTMCYRSRFSHAVWFTTKKHNKRTYYLREVERLRRNLSTFHPFDGCNSAQEWIDLSGHQGIFFSSKMRFDAAVLPFSGRNVITRRKLIHGRHYKFFAIIGDVSGAVVGFPYEFTYPWPVDRDDTLKINNRNIQNFPVEFLDLLKACQLGRTLTFREESDSEIFSDTESSISDTELAEMQKALDEITIPEMEIDF